jgi:hypothetical protein
MKIQFNIDDKNIEAFINALEFAVSNSPQNGSLEFIREIIRQITVKTIIQDIVFVKLEGSLERYTDGSTISITSKFRTELGLSGDFISDDHGLIVILNNVLKLILEENKPGANMSVIKKSSMDDTVTIKDLVNLIIFNYEKS